MTHTPHTADRCASVRRQRCHADIYQLFRKCFIAFRIMTHGAFDPYGGKVCIMDRTDVFREYLDCAATQSMCARSMQDYSRRTQLVSIVTRFEARRLCEQAQQLCYEYAAIRRCCSQPGDNAVT